jgi:putative transposase
VVGIDRGVINLIADSDGKMIPAARYFNHARQRLARAQRTVSDRKKGSKNREKAKLKVARLHRTIRNQRDHALHTLSHTYAQSHGTVVLENLQIRNMVRVGKGLARSILDSGWGKFAELLKYKMLLSGGRVVTVPAACSSQTCACCGHVAAENRKTQEDFACVACGVIDNADLNAAKVILQRFCADESTATGCGGSATGRPEKQQLRVVKRGQRTQGLDLLKAPAFRLG